MNDTKFAVYLKPTEITPPPILYFSCVLKTLQNSVIFQKKKHDLSLDLKNLARY